MERNFELLHAKQWVLVQNTSVFEAKSVKADKSVASVCKENVAILRLFIHWVRRHNRMHMLQNS